MKFSNESWDIERDDDGDYHIRQKSTGLYISMWNEEMRSLLDGVYNLLIELDVEEHGEIDGVTR